MAVCVGDAARSGRIEARPVASSVESGNSAVRRRAIACYFGLNSSQAEARCRDQRVDDDMVIDVATPVAPTRSARRYRRAAASDRRIVPAARFAYRPPSAYQPVSPSASRRDALIFGGGRVAQPPGCSRVPLPRIHA